MLTISFRKKLMVGLVNFFPSAVKVFFYRLMGATIGEDVRIGRGSYILAEKIVLQDGVAVGNDVHIFCKQFVAKEKARIAEEVRIDGESTCEIGRNCFLGPRAYINTVEPVVLEDNVGFGGWIYTHGVWPSYAEGYPRRVAPVTIKKNAYVPPGTIILPGITIGEEAILGTGAVVTKSVPNRSFAVGVPAKVKNSVDEMQQKLTLDQKEARVKEILNDFGKWIRDGFDIEENVKESEHSFALVVNINSFYKKQKCGIYYTREAVSLDVLNSLLTLRNKFSKMTIISLEKIPSVSLAKLSDPLYKDFFDWIDLENYMSKRKGGKIFHYLSWFFGSHYGVRFAYGTN